MSGERRRAQLADLRDLDASERSLATAISLDPANAIARNNLGLVHLARGDADLARACFEEAVRLQTAYADAWGNLGGVLAKLQDFEAAFRCFDRALALSPQDERILVERANALRGSGRIDESTQILRSRALALPFDDNVHFRLPQPRGEVDAGSYRGVGRRPQSGARIAPAAREGRRRGAALAHARGVRCARRAGRARAFRAETAAPGLSSSASRDRSLPGPLPL